MVPRSPPTPPSWLLARFLQRRDMPSPVRLDSGPSRSNIDAGSGRERHLQQALVQPSRDPRPPGWSWCAAFLSLSRPHVHMPPSIPAPSSQHGEATRQALFLCDLESSWHHAHTHKKLEVEFESAVWRPTLSSHFPVSLLDGSTKLFIIEIDTKLHPLVTAQTTRPLSRLSPTQLPDKILSLADLTCRFLLIQFQTPNKTFSLTGTPSSPVLSIVSFTELSTVPSRGFLCSTVPDLPVVGPKSLTRHHSLRPFNLPTSAQDLSCRSPTIPAATSPAGTFPVRSVRHINSPRTRRSPPSRPCMHSTIVWCGKSLSL